MRVGSSVSLRRKGIIFPLLCVMLFSIILSACGTPSESETTTNNREVTVEAPTGLIKEGTLVVGSDTTYPPMEYLDTTTNKYTGFDIDLINEIAARMGLSVEIQKVSFDSIFQDLTNKRFDLVLSAITINEERQQNFDFVPYFRAGESLLVPVGNPKNITTIEGMCGLKVGIQTGTVEQEHAEQATKECTDAGKPAIDITILDSQQEVIDLLVNGRVDATFQDSPVTDYYNSINPGRFEVGGSVVNTAPYGIMIRKGEQSIVDAVTKAFEEVKSDGTYDELFTKWKLTEDQKI